MFHFFFCAFGIELTIQMGLEMAFTLEHAPSAPQALRQAHLLRGKKDRTSTQNMSLHWISSTKTIKLEMSYISILSKNIILLHKAGFIAQ